MDWKRRLALDLLEAISALRFGLKYQEWKYQRRSGIRILERTSPDRISHRLAALRTGGWDLIKNGFKISRLAKSIYSIRLPISISCVFSSGFLC